MAFDLAVPPQFSRPNWVQIDLDALRHNARALALHAAPARLVAVIKAGAYGHGALQVARALYQLPEVAMMGVASVDEAQKLREGGIDTPILLLSAILPEEAAAVVRLKLIATVWTLEVASALQQEAEKEGIRVAVHFKVDTGMSRLGAASCEAVKAFRAISALPNLDITGVYTHFASADEDVDVTSGQISCFHEFCAEVEIPEGALRHAGNSAGALRFPKAHFDLIRPGLALYGVYPYHEENKVVDLKPVMTWKARLTGIKKIPRGQSVSYGGTWTANRESYIAIIPVGYADGYMRSLSNQGQVLLNGELCPVIGRVTMDQIIIDVTDQKVMPQLGDEVTIWGQDLPIEEVADLAGTIPWELMCAVSARVPRLYIDSDCP
ncbi:alanine racemase [bacterium]|nr:MAG: alanine racemase [bacterium]